MIYNLIVLIIVDILISIIIGVNTATSNVTECVLANNSTEYGYLVHNGTHCNSNTLLRYNINECNVSVMPYSMYFNHKKTKQGQRIFSCIVDDICLEMKQYCLNKEYHDNVLFDVVISFIVITNITVLLYFLFIKIFNSKNKQKIYCGSPTEVIVF